MSPLVVVVRVAEATSKLIAFDASYFESGLHSVLKFYFFKDICREKDSITWAIKFETPVDGHGLVIVIFPMHTYMQFVISTNMIVWFTMIHKFNKKIHTSLSWYRAGLEEIFGWLGLYSESLSINIAEWQHCTQKILQKFESHMRSRTQTFTHHYVYSEIYHWEIHQLHFCFRLEDVWSNTMV